MAHELCYVIGVKSCLTQPRAIVARRSCQTRPSIFASRLELLVLRPTTKHSPTACQPKMIDRHHRNSAQHAVFVWAEVTVQSETTRCANAPMTLQLNHRFC
jgi:hypothetical protein